MTQLIITISGKKQSGKTSLAKYLFTEFCNSRIGKKRFVLEKRGKEVLIIDTFNNNSIISIENKSDELQKLYDTFSVKIYSFADPLKDFCVNVFGLSEQQVNGTDDDKQTSTHIEWSSLPDEIRENHKRPRRGCGGSLKQPIGYLTSRELMQVFGSEIVRKLDTNAFPRGAYNKVTKEKYQLAILCDGRFPNEISIGSEIGAKTIRLLRNPLDDKHESEIALDDFPLGEYSLIIPNDDISMVDCHKFVKPYFFDWLKNAGL